MKSITNYRATGHLCTCMLALAAAGCAATSGTSVGEWQQPRTREAPYQTVLVVAVAPDSNARRVFEQTVAAAITDGGGRGIGAYTLSQQVGTSKLSKEVVIAMAEKSGADAVLVTRMLSQEAHQGKSQEEAILHVGRSTSVAQNEDASMTAVMTSNYAVEVVPGSMVIEADAVMESSLYEPATGEKLIYRATTRGHLELGPGDRVEQFAQRFALTLSQRLRSDGVIR
jgi:hypothetical protein